MTEQSLSEAEAAMLELAAYRLEPLRQDGEFLLSRGQHQHHTDASLPSLLVVSPVAEHPAPASLRRLEHEYALRGEREREWAVRPLALIQHQGRTILVLEDPGGEPLDLLLTEPLELGLCLRLAVGLAAALGELHGRGLIHKDLKPTNVLVNAVTGQVWLMGLGVASRLPRERQAPEPPEVIAGTLAYMAPEQTGRMNRSLDARSDLYALGVTLYEMVTGRLPFTAAEPLEWVHCHIARQPVAPGERRKEVPATVSAIIMKLLAKTAEERYQTAAGVERDFRRCLAEWEARSYIADFPLGEHDMPDRLLIPEKLYGREREIDTLLGAFDRVVTSGRPELVLVSGYSGIGKSSVVNELHKVLVPPRGLFASGKFEQYQRDIPYATLAQAFQSLVRSLLGKSDIELSGWRDALSEALGPNGQLMVDLVPELKLVIGDQPPVPELEPQQAQGRFQLVFRRFISVFAQPEHPLALFLDDLQWLDAATLDLLEDLLTRSDLQHLMLIGAYRDNEVTAAHPLMRKLDAIKTAGGKVAEIMLAPLAREHLGQLIGDALRCEPRRAATLAQLVHEKTGGNPFFAIQFISSLAEEGLLTFDHEAARWTWDLERIHAKGYTDNIVELMVGRLARLPAETQEALQQLACVGNIVEITTISMLGTAAEQVHAALWPAVRQELVERLASSYRFVHDRIQEAAYSLIPEELRGEAHLRIGRLLAAHTPPKQREEAIFEIVNQLNRGAALITTREEREQLAELNLNAGQRAKASTAYASALTYLTAGAALLPDDAWERRHELAFALELHRAECEFLTGALAAAEVRFAELASRATSLPDLAAVTRLRVEFFLTADRIDRCVEVGLDYLSRVGVAWSARPTQEEVRQEYERMWRRIGDRPIEALLALPRMADPVACGTMDVLTALVAPAWHTDDNLRSLVIGRMVNLSLGHGNSDASCLAYALVGTVLGPYFGDYKAAYRFCQLGLDLVEQRGVDRLKARVYLFFNQVNAWTRHVRMGRPLVRRAFDTAQQAGDLTYAVLSQNNLITNLLASGEPLAEVQREAEAGLDFARQARFGLVVDFITTQLQLIRTLRGLTPAFGCFEDAGFSEGRFEQHLEADPSLAPAVCWYWIRTLQARFFAGAYASGLEAASKAQQLLWTSPGLFELPEYHLYAALTQAALCDAAAGPELARHLEALAAHHRQLEIWAENCPENFENRAALVGAELARIEGRDRDAMDLYEQAIRSAHANGFVHNEALANEIIARFYAARGFEKIARVYLQDARHYYRSWGAEGKVRQLDQLYPHLRQEAPAPDARGTISAPLDHLDLATVLHVSQAISGELVLEKLLDTLMRTAIEHAGAVRGLLILSRGEELRIAAEATTSGDTVVVHLRDMPVAATALPQTVLHYVVHTRESVILDDASASNPFSDDEYIRRTHARSVLCLPLVKQGALVALLYLENTLAPYVFTPGRIAVLKVLASEAAMALENSRLYRELEEREAKIRRLVDANIVGIFLWNLEGEITEANDAFLAMAGYSRAELVSGRVRWRELTPDQWRAADEQALAELAATGVCAPYEKEFVHQDGSRVPVLAGSALFEGWRDEGVAFVLDLTGRKRAEEALHRAQAELAHINRVTTLGELTASIAHEVNQPLAALTTNANAGLRWLTGQPPNLEEVRECLRRIVRDGVRAGEVIKHLRALVKKAAPAPARLDLREAIQEVLLLTTAEARRHGVVVRTELTPTVPSVRGDRVQLQQVILNLALNGIEAMQAVTERPRELVIRAQPEGAGTVLVAVHDSGSGLDAQSVGRLFEAFYTTKADGLGMGLAISRSIIEAHGGRLWATANGAYGATFQFTVPAEEDTPHD